MSNSTQKSASRLLLIDDDVQLVTMLAELLRLEGYAVAHASTGEAGVTAVRTETPDLVVLDVMMPGMDGFETLTTLRQFSDVPVLMLTARGDTDDRITGLAAGADDYLPKPFNPRELLLRVAAILKRGRETQHDSERLSFGPLELEPGALRACLGGNELTLTGAELRVLEGLMRRPGKVANRDALTEFALGRKRTPYDRALDTHVSNLRHKLGGDEAPIEIRNVRGEGYLLLDRTVDA